MPNTEPKHKESEAVKWQLHDLYNTLDRTKDPVQRSRLKSAISYLGGSLKCRYPVPKGVRGRVNDEDWPIRILGE